MARIVIVEADDDVRALVLIIVARLGHEPVVNLEGSDDLKATDLAIIEPAHADGLAVAERFRAEGIKLIFTTSGKLDPRLLALDPVAYIRKPFTRTELEDSIRAALGGSSAERRNTF